MELQIIPNAQRLDDQLNIIRERGEELNQLIRSKIKILKKKPDFNAGDLISDVLPLAETTEEAVYLAFQIGTTQQQMQGKESVVDTILDSISLRGFKR